jgi:hypothetical protein
LCQFLCYSDRGRVQISLTWSVLYSSRPYSAALPESGKSSNKTQHERNGQTLCELSTSSPCVLEPDQQKWKRDAKNSLGFSHRRVHRQKALVCARHLGTERRFGECSQKVTLCQAKPICWLFASCFSDDGVPPHQVHRLARHSQDRFAAYCIMVAKLAASDSQRFAIFNKITETR